MVSASASASATVATMDLTNLRPPPPAGDPSWLSARRIDAARWVADHGFPTRRDEDWRYFDLSPLLALSFEHPVESGDRGLDGEAAAELASSLSVNLGGPRMVFVNGRRVRSAFSGASESDGFSAGGMAESLASDTAGLSAAEHRDGWYHAFDALNAVLTTDGAFIRLSPGTCLEAPIYLVYLSVPGTASRLANPRSVIVAGPGSRVSLVAHHVGLAGEPVCTNAVTTVVCAEGSRVDYTEIQDAPETAYHLSLLDVRQSADSRFSAHTVSLGGSASRHEVRVGLAGCDAETSLNGLFLPAGHQYHDHPVLVHHVGQGAVSRQLYKGVVGGAGHGVFNGRIVVHRGAAGTDAAQTNKNLLLSEQAEVDTRPRLEIHADDVRCAHGAAAGQLDLDALYYLRSRGIGRADAARMLIGAFVDDVIGRIPHDPVRAHIQARLAERFSGIEEE